MAEERDTREDRKEATASGTLNKRAGGEGFLPDLFQLYIIPSRRYTSAVKQLSKCLRA